MKNAPALIIMLVLGLVGGYGLAMSMDKPVPVKQETIAPQEKKDEPEAGWVRHQDPAGEYRFDHPAGTYVVTSADGGEITVLSAPPDQGTVPDMTLKVAGGHVEFHVWEDFDIPYFDKLVSSFRFTGK